MQHLSRWKPYLRIVILVTILVFLGKTLQEHAQEVVAIRISGQGWTYLAIAFCITLLAHIWIGWVWGLILRELEQPVGSIWAVQVYLKTNIAKYLPSNLLHFYGRVLAATATGVTLGAATVSLLLESLLLAAAGLTTALLTSVWKGWTLQFLCLAAVLIAVHPQVLNRVVQSLRRLKRNPSTAKTTTFKIKRYPIWPLFGELGFLALRGAGFVLTVATLTPTAFGMIPPLIGAFSLGWLLGFITPGIPGGVGIFEVTVITLLGQISDSETGRMLSPGLILSAVALYRLVNTLAEALGAGLAWLYEHRTGRSGDGGT